MEKSVLEMLVVEQADAPPCSATARLSAGKDQSLMTPLGLVAGEILIMVEWLGVTPLRQLIRELDWPLHLVMMAVGMLVCQGLVRATQRELEVIVEPIPEWSRAVQTTVA